MALHRRKSRKYGMFERERGTRRWSRKFPNLEGTKEAMVRIAQNWLIEGAFNPTYERELRPLPTQKD